MINPTKAKVVLLLALLSLPLQLHAAPAQFDIDLKELDRQKPVAAPKPEKKQAPGKRPAKARPRAVKAAPKPAAQGEYIRYTVKPGDHIFKILMANFGMSNEAAERLLPEIVRINDIGNIKALTVGRTLLIPAQVQPERAARPAGKGKRQARRGAGAAAGIPAPAAPEPAPAATAAPAAPTTPEPVPAPRAPEPAPAPKAPAPKAPEPAPAQRAAEPAPRAPEPAPVPGVAPPAPAMPRVNTWICSVSRQDTGKTVDSLLNGIGAPWSRNRIVQSDNGSPTAFSIRVDRYFEYKGVRYIISIGESDPYNYTLIRLLEAAGYRVLRMTGKEDFQSAAEKLFKLIGVAPEPGTHPLHGGGEASGYLVQQDDAGGRQVLFTDRPATPGHKWVLPPGCGAR